MTTLSRFFLLEDTTMTELEAELRRLADRASICWGKAVIGSRDMGEATGERNAYAHAADLARDHAKRAAEDGWRTMESAPRDGTSILVNVPGFGMGLFVLFWMDARWREPAHMNGLKIDPTHWRPLPEPPAA